ncbi:hypothetical protein G647_02775 [Cladophialophora carrionii CBS 160.54]|uniref:Restriction of telomere capping protein 4 n=1 Tax=Cladophialophora carrionii CBS 160.54 TaxID=1279043 RepID=V9DI58_9EURO|nr:uncharacterized protein G647_02775 [Cladophialophora carrionii CBS 160.54]ETI25998.1 hypothetical protein G647_02775 [Cladophialophora carrionii CBS 160.54]
MPIKRKAALAESGIDRNNDNHFVYAPPEDSSEEDTALSEEPASSSPEVLKGRTGKTANSPAKRSATTAAASRSKRQKITNAPSLEQLKAPEVQPPDDLFGFPSSSSQKRRHNKVYGKKFVKIDPIEDELDPSDRKDQFSAPETVEMHVKSITKTEFQLVDHAAGLSPMRIRTKTDQKLAALDSPEPTAKSTKSQFQKFDLPDFPSSNGTENTNSFDVFESPAKESRKRSGSTSSLSSVDELAILAHEHDFKAEQQPRTTGILCPVCEKPVHDSVTLFVPDNLRTLPFQLQQNFCSRHQVADAKEEWEKRGYPKKIYWEELEDFRIREKIPSLKMVISRQAPCFYLGELDAEIKAAKGNRRKIRNYLNEGLINVAKAGYYGPKGARIMTNAVTASLTETLNMALQSDPALKAAGVGAYVSAVLVPELTLRLVMDDMSLKTAKEGRRVLDESSDIGVLLNPDDDQVRLNHEED